MDDWSAGGYSFETDRSLKSESPDEDEEMKAFEAECAKRLAEEHERRAKEEMAADTAQAEEEAPAQDPPEPEEKSDPATEIESELNPEEESASDEKTEADPAPDPPSEAAAEDKESQEEELAAIMQAESNESIIHSGADSEGHKAEDERREEKNDSLPGWLRLLFTLLLMVLGAIGMYIMVCMDYHSYIYDPLCFIEISVCLLTAVGLNAAHIQFRVGKEVIMRIPAFALFAFYIIYAADSLFLKKLLAGGIDKESIVAYAREHINADVISGLTSMSINEMIGCAMMVIPFAFMMLMLLKPFREIVLYILTIVFLFFAVGTVRMLCLVGTFDLSQGCMSLVGAIVAYLLFIFPPVNRILYDAGLILWEYDEEDED